MSLLVHEMRHAGQFYSTFANESVRGQRLSCSNISGRIAEVDAWKNENNWIINSMNGSQQNRLVTDDFDFNTEPLNSGIPWTVDDLWDHPHVTQYRRRYGDRFDGPPVFSCPSATSSAMSCIDPIVLQHI